MTDFVLARQPDSLLRTALQCGMRRGSTIQATMAVGVTPAGSFSLADSRVQLVHHCSAIAANEPQIVVPGEGPRIALTDCAGFSVNYSAGLLVPDRPALVMFNATWRLDQGALIVEWDRNDVQCVPIPRCMHASAAWGHPDLQSRLLKYYRVRNLEALFQHRQSFVLAV